MARQSRKATLSSKDKYETNNDDGINAAEFSDTEQSSSDDKKKNKKKAGRPKKRSLKENESQSQTSERKYAGGQSDEEKYITYDYDRENYGHSDRRHYMRRQGDNAVGYGSEYRRYEGRQMREPYYPEMQDYQKEDSEIYVNEQQHGYHRPEYSRSQERRYERQYDRRPQGYTSGSYNQDQRNYRSEYPERTEYGHRRTKRRSEY